ncbi:hypothetical protein EV204_11249 [Tissierella praeacuta]|uniref:hypothetical protein n=1 Tax=Tissierella praeacuta TaxID=43131 RepID=UPI00104C6707|nr:hypothetical protein [Tissierella praeacuta]TCU67498.1 hypothetical protein EV204_11249 [Tissierella praeacuta]
MKIFIRTENYVPPTKKEKRFMFMVAAIMIGFILWGFIATYINANAFTRSAIYRNVQDVFGYKNIHETQYHEESKTYLVRLYVPNRGSRNKTAQNALDKIRKVCILSSEGLEIGSDVQTLTLFIDSEDWTVSLSTSLKKDTIFNTDWYNIKTYGELMELTNTKVKNR